MGGAPHLVLNSSLLNRVFSFLRFVSVVMLAVPLPRVALGSCFKLDLTIRASAVMEQKQFFWAAGLTHHPLNPTHVFEDAALTASTSGWPCV